MPRGGGTINISPGGQGGLSKNLLWKPGDSALASSSATYQPLTITFSSATYQPLAITLMGKLINEQVLANGQVD